MDESQNDYAKWKEYIEYDSIFAKFKKMQMIL